MSSAMSTLSVPIAAIASWILGALWYNGFDAQWLTAHGKTRDQLVGPSGRPSPLPFALSFIAELVMAAILAILISQLGLRTAAGGMSVGILAWLGFVASTMGVNYAYSRAHPALSLIDGGHWLAVLVLQGFIIGGLA